MAMTRLQRKQNALLTATVRYYGKNPKNRRAVDGGVCVYLDDITGKRCAIGRLVNKETALKLVGRSGDVAAVWPELPDKVKVYGKSFLKALQTLHDGDSFWTAIGLSDKGRERVAIMRRDILLGYF